MAAKFNNGSSHGVLGVLLLGSFALISLMTLFLGFVFNSGIKRRPIKEGGDGAATAPAQRPEDLSDRLEKAASIRAKIYNKLLDFYSEPNTVDSPEREKAAKESVAEESKKLGKLVGAELLPTEIQNLLNAARSEAHRQQYKLPDCVVKLNRELSPAEGPILKLHLAQLAWAVLQTRNGLQPVVSADEAKNSLKTLGVVNGDELESWASGFCFKYRASPAQAIQSLSSQVQGADIGRGSR